MKKTYLDARDYLRDSWRLAGLVLKSDWHPDLILALWRGGAPVGVAVHEYLSYCGRTIDHLPLRCQSYSGIGENAGGVRFVSAESVFASITPGRRVLVVDDVFDTGKTAEAVKVKLDALGVESRFACVYWKPGKNQTTLSPDFFVKSLDNSWIVFPHEMAGLSAEELAEKDTVLSQLIGDISCGIKKQPTV